MTTPGQSGAGGRAPSVSVIIPHLNQLAELLRCLESLRRQSDLTCLAEIIVVDNGSSRSPEDICNQFPQVRLLEEPEAGPGPARNRGASAASGEILAFIDADCIADENWLAEIVRLFRESAEVGVLGGLVTVPRPQGRPLTAVEAYERVYAYRIHSYISRRGFAGTGNLAVRRPVFEEVGPFAGIDVSEDYEWGRRASRLGNEIRFAPEMIVEHPARSSFAELTLKWDRHIAHEYMAMRNRPFWRLKFLLRSLAVAISPAAEVYTVWTARQLSGRDERLKAFGCLTRIRLHRARGMASLLVNGHSAALLGRWNRN